VSYLTSTIQTTSMLFEKKLVDLVRTLIPSEFFLLKHSSSGDFQTLLNWFTFRFKVEQPDPVAIAETGVPIGSANSPWKMSKSLLQSLFVILSRKTIQFVMPAFSLVRLFFLVCSILGLPCRVVQHVPVHLPAEIEQLVVASQVSAYLGARSSVKVGASKLVPDAVQSWIEIFHFPPTEASKRRWFSVDVIRSVVDKPHLCVEASSKKVIGLVVAAGSDLALKDVTPRYAPTFADVTERRFKAGMSAEIGISTLLPFLATRKRHLVKHSPGPGLENTTGLKRALPSAPGPSAKLNRGIMGKHATSTSEPISASSLGQYFERTFTRLPEKPPTPGHFLSLEVFASHNPAPMQEGEAWLEYTLRVFANAFRARMGATSAGSMLNVALLLQPQQPSGSVVVATSVGGASTSAPTVEVQRSLEEDAALRRAAARPGPMPKTLAAFAVHPVYALESQLKQDEAVAPGASSVGFFKGARVFQRSSVSRLLSADEWRRLHGRVVLPEALSRPERLLPRPETVSSGTSLVSSPFPPPPMPVFGLWQTEPFAPPPFTGGPLPRNLHGNFELWNGNEAALPKGLLYVSHPRAKKLAIANGIDAVDVIVGFEKRGIRSFPRMLGVVVSNLKKDGEKLTQICLKDNQARAEKAEAKRLKGIYLKWRALIRGMLIRSRIQNEYGSSI
jgi:hypothetical protein